MILKNDYLYLQTQFTVSGKTGNCNWKNGHILWKKVQSYLENWLIESGKTENYILKNGVCFLKKMVNIILIMVHSIWRNGK